MGHLALKMGFALVLGIAGCSSANNDAGAADESDLTQTPATLTGKAAERLLAAFGNFGVADGAMGGRAQVKVSKVTWG